MKYLVTFDWDVNLKFEMACVKNLVKFGGRTFLSARKAREISGRLSGQISAQISENISEISLESSHRFSETSFSRSATLSIRSS